MVQEVRGKPHSTEQELVQACTQSSFSADSSESGICSICELFRAPEKLTLSVLSLKSCMWPMASKYQTS